MLNRRAWVYLNCTPSLAGSERTRMPVTRGGNHGRTGTDGCRGQYVDRCPPPRPHPFSFNCQLTTADCDPFTCTKLAFGNWPSKNPLVPEVPDAREDHSHAVAVGGL